MAKGYEFGARIPVHLSQGKKSREQECQNCERGIKVENCRNCIFDTLTSAEVDSWDARIGNKKQSLHND